MHPEAYNFVKEFAEGKQFDQVVEFGSLDINGTVRDLIDCSWYYGIDLQPGPGVDEVADAATWDGYYFADLIICCEVLEHSKKWRAIVESAYLNLVHGGWFVVTCATDPRAPHSALDGGPLRPGEYYGNVGMGELGAALLTTGFNVPRIDRHTDRGDLYAVAQKP
jgi:hypothetical protein